MALRPIADIFAACLAFAPSSFSRRRAASSAAAAAAADDPSATAITTAAAATGLPPIELLDRVAADVRRSPALL